MNIKKAFLITAFFAMLVLALLYGLSPGWFVRTFFDIAEIPTDIAHIFRAIMGLYIALGLFWLFSAFSDRYRSAGVATVVVVAAGLVTGRLISLFMDGVPSPLLVSYIAIELLIIPVALWVFRLPE